MGTGNAPAYRGTAYVMFEELPLQQFGNRIPQLSFEVFRPVVEPDTSQGMVRAVTLIPGTGEFVYATEAISRGTHSVSGMGGNTASENVQSQSGVPEVYPEGVWRAPPHARSDHRCHCAGRLETNAGKSGKSWRGATI